MLQTVLGVFYEIKISYVEIPPACLPARLPAGDLESAIADFYEIWYRQGVIKKFTSEFRENGRCECHVVLRGVSEMLDLIFVVPSIMLYSSEISPTRCNNCVFSPQWLYSTCFGRQSHPSSGVGCCVQNILL